MPEIAEHRGAFRYVPYMGVIYVVHEASKLGFWNGHPDWCNLGQGQPEVGDIPGAPPRVNNISFDPGDHAYGPVGGTDALRQAIADHYNRLYRQGKACQYTKDNVTVADGGRLMLTRAFAALSAVKLAYKIPDYTAYEDMISMHMGRIQPVALAGRAEDGFSILAAVLEKEVVEQGIGAFVLSNPCNPTGQVVSGQELKDYVRISRQHACSLILDEFYSHFIYTADGRPGNGPVSAAAHVEDVNADPVVLIDGLTKSFRYPGWRVGWAVGPADMIEVLNRVGSAVDGGPCQPMQQHAAITVLEPARADQETTALRAAFTRKRNLTVERLADMGIKCAQAPRGTFYAWASVADLPAPLNDADGFFRAALQNKVMTVPGPFFDVNPGAQRTDPSPYAQWLRFSFGPPEDNVRMGLDRLAKMIADA